MHIEGTVVVQIVAQKLANFKNSGFLYVKKEILLIKNEITVHFALEKLR